MAGPVGDPPRPDAADMGLIGRILERCEALVRSDPALVDRRAGFEALEQRLASLSAEAIAALMAQPAYRRMRDSLIRDRAELWFEHEVQLAKDALDGTSPNPLEALFDTHIALDAYREELVALRPLAPRRMLIVGSGACPMSAYILSREFGDCRITGLDRSEQACTLSRELLQRSNCKSISVVCADVKCLTDFTGFDSILLTLNVGRNDREKTEIVKWLKRYAAPSAFLLARTASGWSRVLYPSIEIPALNPEAESESKRPENIRGVIVPTRFSSLPD